MAQSLFKRRLTIAGTLLILCISIIANAPPPTGVSADTPGFPNIITSIALDAPRGVAVNPTTNRIYTGTASTSLAVIDGTTNQVVTTILGISGGSINEVAVNSATNRVYVGSYTSATSGAIAIIDGSSNTILTTRITGDIYELQVNSATNRIYYTQRSPAGYFVVTADSNANTITSIPIQGAIVGGELRINETTNRVYHVDDKGLAVYDADLHLITKIELWQDGAPYRLTLNPNTNRAYVGVLSGSLRVIVIDTVTHAIVTRADTISGGMAGFALIANPKSNHVFVQAMSRLFLLDGATNTITADSPFNNDFGGMALNAGSNRIYSASTYYDVLYVLQDEGGTPPGGTISGRVIGTSGTAIPEVTISATGSTNRTTTTDANGNYTLNGLSAGNYTITPSKSEYFFTPGSFPLSVPPDAIGLNFTGQSLNTDPVIVSWIKPVGNQGHYSIAGGTVTLEVAAIARTAVREVEFWRTDENLSTEKIGTDNAPPYQISVDVTTLAKGANGMIAHAFDDQGHVDGESIVIHRIDNTVLVFLPVIGIPSLDRNISNSTDAYEGETSAASSGTLLIAGSHRIYVGKCDSSAKPGAFGDCAPVAYASTDGVSWTKTQLPRTWKGKAFGAGVDPSVEVDKNGVFYYSYLALSVTNYKPDLFPNAIVLVKSSDGIHWAQLTPVTFNTGGIFASGELDDRPYLAVDRSNSAFTNRIYVAWTRNTKQFGDTKNQTIDIATSSDGGKSWSDPIKVNDDVPDAHGLVGAYPAIDNNTGTIYVAWHDFAKDKILVDKNMKGGVPTSWGKDVTVVSTHFGGDRIGEDIGCVDGRLQGPNHVLKVGSSGNLYLVYPDKVTGRGLDVLFTKSTDGGIHWSAPITLSKDTSTADQFQPTLSVEPNGMGGDKVTVSFYDRRDDPNNCLAHVYATQSTDNGKNWSAIVRITSAASNFDGVSHDSGGNGPGDYSSSTPFKGAVWLFFADRRSSAQSKPGGAFDVYAARVEP